MTVSVVHAIRIVFTVCSIVCTKHGGANKNSCLYKRKFYLTLLQAEGAWLCTRLGTNPQELIYIYIYIYALFVFSFVFGATAPQWARASSFLMFLDHTQRRTTVGRAPGRVISSSQRPLPDKTRHTQETDVHAPGGIRTYNLSKRVAVDLRLRPHGHWDR